MSESQVQPDAAIRVNIEQLHIRLRGVSPSQARRLAEGLGEQVLRQLAALLPAGDSSHSTPWQNQDGSPMQVNVDQIQLTASPANIPQAVARSAAQQINSEGYR
jgi:hypothetical protein